MRKKKRVTAWLERPRRGVTIRDVKWTVFGTDMDLDGDSTYTVVVIGDHAAEGLYILEESNEKIFESDEHYPWKVVMEAE